MNRPLSALLALALVPLLGPSAAAQHVEYTSFRLDNGLNVILHEDHRLPQASVNLWYYVGSKDEPPGRSGFAHLFEHLMFMGTERAPGSTFDDLMESGGGSNNASTSEDRTNYFESGPSELLPTLLWLEADRMEELGESMTQEKLDKQREIVRNERRQSYENRPYGSADLLSQELLFPQGHPYHIPVIGTHADLKAATVEDVKQFFATYYVPCNASLVVAGDFDPQAVRAMIERLFAGIPRGGDPVHREATPVKLEHEIRTTTTDAVQFAKTTMTWHSPGVFEPGDAELDLLGGILSDGISSRLYQKLVVQDEVAVDVEAYQASMLLGSTFSIGALARPGVSLDEVEQAIDEVLVELRRDGPKREEVERQKAKLEFKSLEGLQSIMEKADRLNRYQFHFGEPDSFARDLDRYRNASAEGVREWTRRVLDPGARLVMRVLPKAEETGANTRDERPVATPAPAFTPAGPTNEFQLANGLRVMHWMRSDLPLVELHLILSAGAAQDPTGKSGLADLTADMLDEGAGERSAVEFANALDLLGARLSTSAETEWTHLRLSVLERNLKDAAQLASDALLRPRFDESEWKRVRDLHVQALRQAEDDPTRVAQRVSMQAFFGRNHIYGRPSDGSVDTVEAIGLDDVRTFHDRAYQAQGAVLLVAGDLGEDEARSVAEAAFGALASGTERARPGASQLPPPANQHLRVVLVDRPGAVQTVVRFMMPAPAFDAPERPERELVALILGGTFTSRLNQNLREDKGYTYGARAGFTFATSTSWLTAGANVRTDVTGASIGEFLKEFRALRTGDVSEVEAQKAKATERQRTVASFATLGGVLRAAAERVEHGLAFATLGAELEEVARADAAELNRLAASTVPLDSGLLVLVGDRAAILPQLEGLDLPAPEELDVEGRPVAHD